MLKRKIRKPATGEHKAASIADLIALHGAGDNAAAVVPRPGFTSNVIAYRSIRMIAEAAASVPLQVTERDRRIVDSDLGRLLARPNPDQTGTELLEEVYGFLQTHGNAYLEKLGEEAPRLLCLVHPDTIEITEKGYRQQLPKGERMIRPDPFGGMPLLHLSLWQPGGGSRGHAPLATARQAIHLHNAAQAWNRQLLENAARPSGALIHKGGDGGQHLTPEQFDRLRSELDHGFSGLRGAGRPLLLDGGLDWKPMAMTPAEMDFQNLKASAARDIALAFGVPPMLLGIPGDNTYTNYREANLAFWRQTILPLVRKVASALSLWLEPGQVLKIEPDLSALEALSPERSARLDRIVAADFLTDAEKRQALGFAPEPEGFSA